MGNPILYNTTGVKTKKESPVNAVSQEESIQDDTIKQ